ncbi:MAG: hypothetical protein QOI16_1207 [Pseudonocardiales bacterium]|nr:hypothetical protein [Pseudonocardiales bacterium]
MVVRAVLDMFALSYLPVLIERAIRRSISQGHTAHVR